MVQPNDYSLNVADPSSKFLEGYSAGLGGLERRQAMDLRAAQEARTAELHPLAVRGAELGLEGQVIGNETARFGLDQRRSAAARQQAFLQDFSALAALGTDMSFGDVQGLVAQYPEMSDSILGTWDALDDAARAPMAKALAQGIVALRGNNVDLAEQVVTEYAVAAENAGNLQDAAIARAGIEIMRSDPNAALATLSSALAIADPEMAQRAMGGAGDDSVQRSIVYQNGTVLRIMRSGQRVVTDPDNNVVDGADAARVIAEGRDSGVEQEFDESRARGQGGVLGKAAGQAIVDLPAAVSVAENSITLIDRIVANPALKEITGKFDSMRPKLLLSQAGVDLVADFERIQGIIFMEAYQNLRGGGQITEVEGLKAEQAMANLDRAQSEKAVIEALTDLREVIAAGIERAKGEAARLQNVEMAPDASAPGVPPIDIPAEAPGTGTVNALDELLRSLEGGAQ